ncbi:MAG: hypothetical protein KDK25_05460 [Leptospiraceae bacterium]|nr:hypothetical protein [Leptospiraceae bacterium]
MGFLFRIVPFILLFPFLQCFSTPDWIHRLPEEEIVSAENYPSIEPGTYIRPVSSRYDVADPHSLSSSTQEIRILKEGAKLVFYRIHTYEEWVRGEAYRSIYGEKGQVEQKGPWVLLRPRFVYRTEQGPVRLEHETSGRRCVQPMDISEAVHRLNIRKKIIEGEPLLYFHSDEGALIPMAFEEEGQIFRFGFYEQLSAPYDTGPLLESTGEELTLMAMDSHGYFPAGSRFLELYSRDPALDVQKEMGLPLDCIQEFRPTQSSK